MVAVLLDGVEQCLADVAAYVRQARTLAAQPSRHIELARGAGKVERLPAQPIGCIDVGARAAQPSRHLDMTIGAGEMERLPALVIKSEDVGALNMQPLRHIEIATLTGAVDRLTVRPAIVVTGRIDVGAPAAQPARLVEFAVGASFVKKQTKGTARAFGIDFDVDSSSRHINHDAPGPLLGGMHEAAPG